MTLSDRLGSLRQRILDACDASGRSAKDVTLIAASKGATSAQVAELADCGVVDFGENYLQESRLKRETCRSGLAWHFIGRIQSNKARQIGKEFDWIHTIDSLKTAKVVSRGAEESGSIKDVLIEVNIADEPNKGGVEPSGVANLAELVYYEPGVRLRGLMTMGPANRNAEELRPYFQAMRRLLEGLSIEGADCLSMGMSHDFDVAIQEGATHVRVGTALFGRRKI